jgi:very-short-patch-repair endonuclease
MPRYHYKSYRDIILLARNLRKNQTKYERLVWQVLRRKNFMGFKFIKQHPVFYRIDRGWTDFFIADFYCAKLKLIIEVDGKIHETQFAYDKERDDKLNSKGILVVRIKNEELTDINSVIDKLSRTVRARENEMLNLKQQLN